MNANWLPRIAICYAISFVGCEHNRTEYSETLTEYGQVYDTAFVPAGHGHDTAIGYNTGEGGGVTITPINITIPARYAVVFQCQHGKFVIDGDTAESLYQRLNRGDKVKITYREIHRVVYEGEKELSRSIVDLDFLDAVKTGPQALTRDIR